MLDPTTAPQVLKAEPSNAEALMLRSKAYFLLNDLGMSKRHLAEVLKYDDGHAAARAEFKKIKDLIKLKEKVGSLSTTFLRCPHTFRSCRRVMRVS